jgi:hypothetical protein
MKAKKTKKKWAKHRTREKKRGVIEKMWAEDGMVRTLDVNGKITQKTPDDAAKYIQEINRMFPTNLAKVPLELQSEAKRVHAFIIRAIGVIREAKHQVESSVGNATLVHNMYTGLTPDGKVPDQEKDEDTIIRNLQMQYPGLKFEEIRAVRREKSMPLEMKETILSEMNAMRMAEKFGFKM